MKAPRPSPRRFGGCCGSGARAVCGRLGQVVGFGSWNATLPIAFIMQPTRLRSVERKSFADMDCSVAQCLEVVGEWWSMLIVRDAFLGVTRFDEFQRRLGISRNILQQRLARLVDAGVLVRVPYSEHPPRHDYRLTDKGRDLWPVLTAMRQWGDKYDWPTDEGHPQGLWLSFRGCAGLWDVPGADRAERRGSAASAWARWLGIGAPAGPPRVLTSGDPTGSSRADLDQPPRAAARRSSVRLIVHLRHAL
jgi:DNA-binding HxlR family transcriptional regulator